MILEKTGVNFCEVDTSEGRVLIPYEIEESKRSHYIRLTVSRHNNALLRVPVMTEEEEALSFLRAQGDWILEKFGEFRKAKKLSEHLRSKPYVSAYGRRVQVVMRHAVEEARLACDFDSWSASLFFDANGDMDMQIRCALQNFAKVVVKKRAVGLAAKLGLAVDRISVRDQATVWGACSDKGNISLNWRLIFLPPRLHDHIIYHELAHITYLNHSPEFWSLLQQYDGRSASHDEQVTALSGEIMALGRF